VRADDRGRRLVGSSSTGEATADSIEAFVVRADVRRHEVKTR